MFFLQLFSSQKCDYFRNFRPKNVIVLKIFVGFFVILFAYIEKNHYSCTRLGIKYIVWHENIPFKV